MAKAESTTKKMKRIVIQKTKICNYGRARYQYENAVAREPEYTLSRSFHNSVKYQLPVTYDRDAYMMFIKKWGTVCNSSYIHVCRHLIVIFYNECVYP